MNTLVTFSAIFLVAYSLPGNATAGSLFIARGLLESAPPSDSEMTTARYEVVEEGRGHMESNRLLVVFRTIKEKTETLPSDAILLLEKGAWGQLPDGKGRGIYNAIGHDSQAGILPYSVEAWAGILQKTDEELSDAPEANRLPVEKATALLRERLYEKYESPLYIYFYPPRRVPYCWSIAALCVRNGAVKKLTVRISDTGRIISETPNHYPIKFFDSMDVTAEEMDQFVRVYHRNTPPEEWPMWDPESSSLAEPASQYRHEE